MFEIFVSDSANWSRLTFIFALLNWIESGGGKWRAFSLSLSLSLSRSLSDLWRIFCWGNFLPFSGNSGIHSWSLAEAQLQPPSLSSFSLMSCINKGWKRNRSLQYKAKPEVLFSVNKYFRHPWVTCRKSKSTEIIQNENNSLLTWPQKTHTGAELWLGLGPKAHKNSQEWLPLCAWKSMFEL